MRKGDFIRIFYAYLVLWFMMVLLAINYKKYGLSKVNDDYYLTFVVIIAMLVSSLTNMIWGCILDGFSYKWMSIISILLSGVMSLIFPIVASQGKMGFGVGMYLIIYIYQSIAS